jgi:hypothetical protein
LADWQAVVIGGGLINGVSQSGAWPRERFSELLEDRPHLAKRWRSAIERAQTMADDASTPAGTRYDALRMRGVLDFKQSGERLLGYLGPQSHPELEMGAVSALGDIDSTESTRALIDSYPKLHRHNQPIAVKALLRTPERCAALRAAMEAGHIPSDGVSQEQAALIRNSAAVAK